VSDVFVSYSRRDSEFVHALAADLEQRGKSVWIDTEGIGDGEVFPDAIRHAIEQADAFLFVITPESVASTYCETEVEYALELHKRVVPVLREPVPDEQLPEAIRVRNWVPFTPDADAAVASERLVAAINTDLAHAHAHTRWLVKALEWEAEARDRSFLLRGSELAAADAWLAGVRDAAEPAPTALQREYIYASRTASSRRQRMLVAGSITIAVISLALVVFALISRSQAVRAQSKATSEAVQSTSRVWASESAQQLTVDPERSILLAMAAVTKAPTADAVFALRRALDVSPLRVRLPDVGSQASTPYWGAGISYSPVQDGRLIAEGSQDGKVRIFDSASGRTVRTIDVGAPAAIVQYSPDGRVLAIGDTHDVRTVDAATGKTLRVTKLPADAYYGGIGNLTFSPDGRTLYFTDYSHVVRWDLANGATRVLANMDIRGVGTAGLFFTLISPDGRRLIVAGWPGVAVLDAGSGRVLATSTDIPTIWWITLTPDGRQIAVTDSPLWPSGGVAGTLELLNARTLRVTRTLGHLDGDAYTALGFSPDGTRLAYGTNEGSAGVIDLRTGNLLVPFPGHTTNIYQVQFSPDGLRVATSAGDGHAFVWRAAGNQERSIVTDGFNEGKNGWMNADLTMVGTRIVARYQPVRGPDASGQVVRAWSSSGTSGGAPLALGPEATYARMSGNGAVVVGGPLLPGAIEIKGTLVVQRVPDGSVLRRLPIDANCCPALSRNGRMLIYQQTTGGALKVVNLTDGQTRTLQHTASPCGWIDFALSPDGLFAAATASCGRAREWSTSTGQPVGPIINFVGFMNLGPLQISNDDKTLAVANSGNVGQVSIVQPRTGNVIAVLTGDTKGIQDLAFSPNDSLLATASLDGTARIWDAHTGQPLRILDDPAPLDNVAFSPDGTQVATLDYAGVINIWNACSDCRNPAALMRLAQRQVTRQLTPAERRTFLG
jgi:WD40 repeat protein